MVKGNVKTSKPGSPEVLNEICFGESRNLKDMSACVDILVRQYAKINLLVDTRAVRIEVLNRFMVGVECGRLHVFFVKNKVDEVVATLSLTLDSVRGLETDKLFGEELTSWRAQGARNVAEIGDLAVNVEKGAKEILLLLMAKMFISAKKIGVCNFVVTCHPSHSCLYRKRMGFRFLTEEVKPHPKVNDAPAVCLVANCDEMSHRKFNSEQLDEALGLRRCA